MPVPLSFQNIEKIVSNFRILDSRLDISAPLKKPYHRRKENFYNQINAVLERRHGMIHRLEFDYEYHSENFRKDIEDVKVALRRVYEYICAVYEWEPELIVI